MGRRIAQWASELDLLLKWDRPGFQLYQKFKGLRGATGTQASYLALFAGNHNAVEELEARVTFARSERGNHELDCSDEALQSWRVAGISYAEAWQRAAEHRGDAPNAQHQQREAERWRDMTAVELKACRLGKLREVHTFSLVTQTYPRVIDTFILADLASCASVLHKVATDIRLLCNRKELDEPFEDKQIGSSAMPYKRNPMRCERICGLTRFVINLVGNAYDTAATQWLERTLDDSSNRRLSLPEAFLALDGALDLMHNVASGLIVHEAMVRKNLMAELPFMATENILMACVKLGGDRQHYHELIRQHAQAAGMRVKQEGLDNDLLDRLKADKNFQSKARGGTLSAELDWEGVMDPMKYIGRSVEQTERFIKDVVEPLCEQYGDAIKALDESGPKV
jgi:adenylosuccinate lyase